MVGLAYGGMSTPGAATSTKCIVVQDDLQGHSLSRFEIRLMVFQRETPL